MNAIPSENFAYVIICMMVYCYLLYWGVVGIFVLILLFVWVFRSISFRRQLRLPILREIEQDTNIEVYDENGMLEPMDQLTMNESDYNPYLHESLSECIICMEIFVDGGKVTALPCDERHYFHSGCILSWSERHRNCPLCKKPFNVRDIKKFNKQFIALRK